MQRERQRGEACSPWGAWCRTQCQDPGIMTWAEDRCSTTEPPRCPSFPFFFLFIDFIYLFMRDTEREAETQAEGGEAGSMQGAPCGIRSQDWGSHPERRKQTLNRCATQASLIYLLLYPICFSFQLCSDYKQIMCILLPNLPILL